MQVSPGNSNPKRSRLKRFFRFLGKLLLGLLFLFILLIFLLHSSLIQHRIAKRLTTYLSASTKGTVEMEDL
ncbi:MAG TPA: hypothetical protein VFV79_05060, partial [Saprospiraceae bacterium]|nr:hypothetical protein [Saprospiraceae bacterium]